MESIKIKKIVSNIIFGFIIAMICLISIEALLNMMPLNDYYWHYPIGKWIVENKEIPKFGLYSWYAQENNLYWFSHEWGSEVLLYLMSFSKPFSAMILSCIFNIIVFSFFALKTKKHIENHPLLYILFFILSIKITMYYMYPRPHMISYFLLIALLYILFDYVKNTKSKLIYGLPIISILWANIHGGSSNLIYILPIIFFVTTLFNFSIGKIECQKIGKQASIKLLVITIISTLALMINPHGYKLLLYPFENMQNEFMMDIIIEWGSPNIKKFMGLIKFIPAGIMTLCFIMTKKKIKAQDLLVFLFFMYMYLRSERFIPMLIFTSMFFIFEYAPEDVMFLFTDKNIDKRIKLAISTFSITTMIGSCVLLTNTIIQSKDIDIIDNKISQDAVECLNEINPKRLYNHYNIGGELIYNEIDVFIDGRADMYSGHNFEEYVDISALSVNDKSKCVTEDLINKYKFDAFVCLKNESLNYYLTTHPEQFELVFSDENINIYITKKKYIMSNTYNSEQMILDKLQLKQEVWF